MQHFAHTVMLALTIVASLTQFLARPTETSPEEPSAPMEKLEVAPDKNETFPAYRPGYVILADVLADVEYPNVADSLMVQEIVDELVSTGRSLPEMWEEALSHPIGVQALKLNIQSSVLWVARVLWTESNRVSEFEDVAEVVRNRKDSGFGGETEYRTVILDRLQFSHFNSERGRDQMEATGYHSQKINFQDAIRIAFKVVSRPDGERAFPRNVYHYYSAVSMSPRYGTYCHKRHTAYEIRLLGRDHPKWAHKGQVRLTAADPDRFRFMSGV